MFITRALGETNDNVGKAAEMLGLHRNTLSRKMAEYRIKTKCLRPTVRPGSGVRAPLRSGSPSAGPDSRSAASPNSVY